MSIDDADIRSTTRKIWSTVLGLELKPLSSAPEEDGARASTACVLISGDWEGAVMLQSKTDAARLFVARMFESTPEELSEDDFDDGLGELVNLVGGNFKNQVGGVCELSLPAVVHGREHVFRLPRSHLVDQAPFDVDGSQLTVSVFERDRGGAVKRGPRPQDP